MDTVVVVSESMIDQVARDLAIQAMAAINSHTLVCSERQRHIETRMDHAQSQRDRLESKLEEVHSNNHELIRGIRRDIWKGMVFFIVTLLSIVAFLIVRALFPA